MCKIVQKEWLTEKEKNRNRQMGEWQMEKQRRRQALAEIRRICKLVQRQGSAEWQREQIQMGDWQMSKQRHM